VTGYPLPRKTATEFVGNRSKEVLSNRRLVIQKIAPVLTQMEKRKKQDIQFWENKTGCRVTKSEKSGRYRYYDIDSNTKVGSQEYKRRYISILHNGRPDRLSNAHLWMSKLHRNSAMDWVGGESKNTLGTERMQNDNYSQDPYFSEHSIPMEYDCQNQNQVENDLMKQKEAFSPPMSKKRVHNENIRIRNVGSNDHLEICDLSLSLENGHEVEILPRSFSASESNVAVEISEASSEDTDDNPQGSMPSFPNVSMPSDQVAPMVEDGVMSDAIEILHQRPPPMSHRHGDDRSMDIEKKDDTDTIPLLPFPSRDMGSIDPDIAAAEKRLWDKIDSALHEYSGEVMMIEKKKRSVGIGVHPLAGKQVSTHNEKEP